MLSGLRSVVRYLAILCESSEYPSSGISSAAPPSSTCIGAIESAPSSASMKSSMSISYASSMSSDSVRGLLDSPSAAVCLCPGTWRTSKSNILIYAIHLVTRAPGRSVADRLSCATRTLASVSRMKCAPYSQYRTFRSALSTARHSRFVASYSDSALFHSPLSYLDGCLLPSASSCMSTAPHPFLLASGASIISPAPSA